jgi:LPXTG-motif cell wall-anchored protein
MPRTGAAENAMLVMIALVVAAFAVTGGLALRMVRNR